MDFYRGIWASERVCNLAGRFLKIAAEKKLNFLLSLNEAVLLMKYRGLKENLRLINKRQQTKLKTKYGPLETRYRNKIIYQELLQHISGLSKADIRKEVIKKAEREKELNVRLKAEKGRLQREYDSFLLQCIRFEKFINNIADLYRNRISFLSQRIKNKERMQSAERELTDLFCKGISEAVEYCRSQLESNNKFK